MIIASAITSSQYGNGSTGGVGASSTSSSLLSSSSSSSSSSNSSIVRPSSSCSPISSSTSDSSPKGYSSSSRKMTSGSMLQQQQHSNRYHPYGDGLYGGGGGSGPVAVGSNSTTTTGSQFLPYGVNLPVMGSSQYYDLSSYNQQFYQQTADFTQSYSNRSFDYQSLYQTDAQQQQQHQQPVQQQIQQQPGQFYYGNNVGGGDNFMTAASFKNSAALLLNNQYADGASQYMVSEVFYPNGGGGFMDGEFVKKQTTAASLSDSASASSSSSSVSISSSSSSSLSSTPLSSPNASNKHPLKPAKKLNLPNGNRLAVNQHNHHQSRYSQELASNRLQNKKQKLNNGHASTKMTNGKSKMVKVESGVKSAGNENHQQDLVKCSTGEMIDPMGGGGVPHEPKKRVSANKKERRRTLSINNAFKDLRDHIPDIPGDTKLSKIKTLKLAINYIEHLMKLLEKNDPSSFESFKPDLGKLRRECRSREIKLEVERKAKGRTGWPSEVWSTELKKKLNDSNPNQNHSTTSPPTGGKVKIVNDMIMLNSHSHSQGHGLNGKSLKSSYHGSNDYMVKYNNGKQSASSALSTTNNPNTYTFSGNDFNRMCKSNYYSNLNENT